MPLLYRRSDGDGEQHRDGGCEPGEERTGDVRDGAGKDGTDGLCNAEDHRISGNRGTPRGLSR
jgi:hypothetical protein